MRLRDLRKLVEQFSAGGGLVVGDWVDLVLEEVPTFPASDSYPIAAAPVPTELELRYTAQPNESGGFWFHNPDTGAFYLESFTSWGDVTHAVHVRSIIPANVPVEISPLFGGAGWIVENIRRRNLG